MNKEIKKNIVIYSIIKNIFTAFWLFIILGIAWYFWGDNLNLNKTAEIIGIIVIALLTVWSCFITPLIRLKTWSYHIDEKCVEYTEGVFSVRKTVIPMGKIQQVGTVTNPLLRKFGLIEVSIHSLTKTHSLRLIAIKESEEIISRIKSILKDTYLKDLQKREVQDNGEK